MSFRHREHELEEHEHNHDHNGDHETSGNTTEVKMVARTFRYMRRKPTIIAYKPPQGNNWTNIVCNVKGTHWILFCPNEAYLK